MLSFLGLSALALSAGFLSAYMGIGGGIIIVSLLPIFTDFSPQEVIQISLCMVFFLTLSNSLIFLRKNLVAWDWTFSLIVTGGGIAFLSGSLVPGLSDFSIRFLLWCFLLLVVIFPFIVKKLSHKIETINATNSSSPAWFKFIGLLSKRKKSKSITPDQHKNPIQQNSLKVFGGVLMGLCSGLAGIGGGIILSPLLHESSLLSLKKISPSLSFVTLFLSVFALSGQLSQGISLHASMKTVLFNLILFAIIGLVLGHFFHGKDDRKKRIFIVRTVTVVLFLKVSTELIFLY